MHYPIDKVITNFLGQDIKKVDLDKNTGQQIESGWFTYLDLIGRLVTTIGQNETVTGETKHLLGQIADKLYSAGSEVELTTKQCQLIIERGELYATVLELFRLNQFIEGTLPEPKEADIGQDGHDYSAKQAQETEATDTEFKPEDEQPAQTPNKPV
jgi:hypothetical protein